MTDSTKPDPDQLSFMQWLMDLKRVSVLIEPTDLRRHLYRWGVEAGVLPRPQPGGATNNAQLNRLAEAWRDKAKRDRIVEEARRYWLRRRKRALARGDDWT